MSEQGSDFGRELLACAVDGTAADERPLRHVSDLSARRATTRPWPSWVEPDVLRAFVERGITEPWSHQVAAADLAHSGRHVVISTGTASGKSLAYQLPIAVSYTHLDAEALCWDVGEIVELRGRSASTQLARPVNLFMPTGVEASR